MLNLSWQTVSLTSIFSEAPFVIVSGSHSTHHGRMPIEHNSIATWVEVRRETHFVIYWEIFPNRARSHWLLWGHMTSNNETVFCQNLWAGKIAKSMTSEGNVTREFWRTTAVTGGLSFPRPNRKPHRCLVSFLLEERPSNKRSWFRILARPPNRVFELHHVAPKGNPLRKRFFHLSL